MLKVLHKCTNHHTAKIPGVCKMSNMTNQNLSRTHVHCLGVKHFQASNPCKLSLLWNTTENSIKAMKWGRWKIFEQSIYAYPDSEGTPMPQLPLLHKICIHPQFLMQVKTNNITSHRIIYRYQLLPMDQSCILQT